MFFQQLVNGITLGSIYALFALGYTMVYGILLMINFAHSEIFMVGAYLGFWALSLLPVWVQGWTPGYFTLVFAIAMMGAGLLAVTIERVAYRPLRRASRLAPLISAIGVSIFLQNLIQVTVSAQSQPYPDTFKISHYEFFGVQVNSLQIFIFALAISAMVLLQVFITKTRLGKAMRATAQNHTVSQLMGINVNFIITVTFLIGGALGGLAGVLNGMYYGSIKFNMGFFPGLKAFTAAVVGGIGNIKGAMVGGFLLGIIEALTVGYISSAYKDVILFAVLILVLIFRPSGIFGEEVTEKT
ncbi:MAG: branched-chain amino acid ABC transporter permease [candidate division Zixibacteria bacterium]|jgi:branched-chain amino acid transport system permease protein|nr:branched-chain amino acid ABC transporter permease [candidate division Zixibacteria bacterium]